MQLDPNIILQARQQEDPMSTMVKMMNLKQLANQNAVSDLELQKKQQMSELIKANTKAGPDGKFAIDYEGASQQAMQGGNSEAAMAMHKMFQEHGLEKMKFGTDAMKMLLSNGSAENFGDIKSQAMKLGVPNADKLPDKVTPEQYKQIQSRTMDIDKQLSNARAETELGYRGREVAVKEAEVGKKAKTDITNIATEMRKERNQLPTTKATQEVSVAYNKIQKLSKAATAAGDMGMIFSFMKILDPGSTVREGEYATAQNATGLPARVVNAYNNALKGEKLNEGQRSDFLNQSKSLYQSQVDVQNQVDSQYSALASKNGIDPKEVILNFEANNPDVKPKWAK